METLYPPPLIFNHPYFPFLNSSDPSRGALTPARLTPCLANLPLLPPPLHQIGFTLAGPQTWLEKQRVGSEREKGGS